MVSGDTKMFNTVSEDVFVFYPMLRRPVCSTLRQTVYTDDLTPTSVGSDGRVKGVKACVFELR